MANASDILALTWPIKMEYLTGWQTMLLFIGLALPIVWMGMRSLAGLGPVRKWVAIGVRLAVLLLFVLILGGMRWQREHRDLEVMVVRDVSDSTKQARNFPGDNLQKSIDEYILSLGRTGTKPPDDRIGVIGFHENATIEAMPNTYLSLETRPIREAGNGTNVASALQLALATAAKDAMHRVLLIWDGNQTSGDLEAAINSAVAQGVPIDVMPISYNVQNEIMIERFISPTWKRENEPFTVDVILRSTNALPTTGNLTLLHQRVPMDLDPGTPGVQTTRRVTLKPGLNVERVLVAGAGYGVNHFHPIFEGDNVEASVGGNPAGTGNDTLLQNNVADGFTFIRGKGQVLLVDNADEGKGEYLRQALEAEQINVNKERFTVDQFPTDLMSLANYDAIILVNVPRGAGGLSDEQQSNLAAYVHDMGGGLVMVGGEQAFGAGGWNGSKLEQVLPVNMDIPAQRQIPKGALVLIMHSCEMPDGNYWGELCAIKAVEAVSARDEVGVVSFGFQGGSVWDFPLQERGDGSKVIAAIKKMQLGDMPSFDESMDLALNGTNNQGGLKHSDARQKHAIIISDGDPSRPNNALLQAYIDAKISISTVTVYPHTGDPDGLPPVMKDIATATRGRAYGPINSNPNQLPQIFIKEAAVVRRSLIFEESKGIPVQRTDDTASDMIKGFDAFPNIKGLVLTSRKPDPQVQVPLVVNKNHDPLLAHWQTGAGKAAVYTSDAHNRWANEWVGWQGYRKFWAQVVRSVSRPPQSKEFDIQTTHDGTKGKIVVEALNKDSGFLNFLSIEGTVVGPDGESRRVRLLQTGPGTYEGEFETKDPGSYVAMMNYRSAGSDQGGVLFSGVAMNGSVELRDLRSQEGVLRQIAERTRGRVIEPFESGFDPFTRDGLTKTASPLPVWDILIPILLSLILIDVATRRIAWDWQSTKRMALATADYVRSFTTVRKVETRQTLDALQRIRTEGAAKVDEAQPQLRSTTAAPARPDPSAKFQARSGVEGDITQVVGGAVDKPVPSAPKGKIEPKGAPGAAGGHTGSLLEAKRRARQQIEQKEKGE